MTWMIVVTITVFILLVLLAGVRPKRAEMSRFELERRTDAGDSEAQTTLRREQLLGDVESLLRIKVALLLVVFVLLSVATFGWLFGTIIATVVALEYGAVARVPLWRQWGQRIFDRYEPHLLRLVEKYHKVFMLIRTLPPEVPRLQIDSREELEYLVANSGNILTLDEKRIITASLGFGEREVRDIMTPRSVIDSVSRKEHLGPLVLDDLHKTGRSRFPVIDGDIDHVVGMLYIQDLLTIDAKRKSTSVEKAMDPRVFYIHESQTLAHALAAFLRTRHHLFIVVNEFRETVGLLSLEDVMEALLGRKINDEFDTHEDLRVVAARNPRGNNRSKTATDV